MGAYIDLRSVKKRKRETRDEGEKGGSSSSVKMVV
jgi:hypothetical protein